MTVEEMMDVEEEVIREMAEAGTKQTIEKHEREQDAAMMLEIVQAFKHEINTVRMRLHEAESRLRRYDSAFERMFKEELDSRINGKQYGEKEAACMVDPLWTIEQYLIQRQKGAKLGHY